MKISRILHAGYIFQSGDTQIAFDPIFENPFSRNCFAFPNVEFDHRKIRDLKLDAVFISHYHDDHCSLESLNLLDRQTPIYIYCLFDELFAWIRQLGFKKVYSLKLNSSIVVGEFEITPRRALDADVDSLFHIKAAGLDVLNVVDSWIDLETLDLLKQTSWDLILWPFQTMREIEVLSPSRFSRVPEGIPPEWIEQLKELKPKNIVPSSCQFIHESWSWYNQALFPISYIAFAEEVEEVLPETKIIRLDPSLSICLSKNFWERSASLDWIFPIGNQDVDYDYQMDFTPQPISEIAKHFDKLSAPQEEKVFQFCRKGLLERFRALEQIENSYFSTPRSWRLAVYDHLGQASYFSYHIDGSKIALFPENIDMPQWTTEVSIAKIYGALEEGESLSSMYVRINDFVFESSIEREMSQVDVMEDPLVRCLFNGSFGTYQKTQLKHLLQP